MGELYAAIWSDLFKEPVDELPKQETAIRDVLKREFLGGAWYQVYELLEFAITSNANGNRDRLEQEISKVLLEEMAGFRWIGGMFVEITSEDEVAAIEAALSGTASDRFRPAKAHLETALAMLSDRTSPNYRNSIKESISAVEAVAQILTGDPQAELGRALKALRTDAPIHGALRSALMSLYGYTSDADGIRHALTDEENLDASDAKFMLIACSAFVVYLIQKSGCNRG